MRLNQDMPTMGVFSLEVCDIGRLGFNDPASNIHIQNCHMPSVVKIATELFKNRFHALFTRMAGEKLQEKLFIKLFDLLLSAFGQQIGGHVI